MEQEPSGLYRPMNTQSSTALVGPSAWHLPTNQQGFFFQVSDSL